MNRLTGIRFIKQVEFKAIFLLLLLSFFSGSAFSIGESSADFSVTPPLVTNNSTPLTMLLLSNDHQLWIKAYTDYTDLDEDGTLDITYNDNFEYYGYFNSNFCYDYDTTALRYEPDGQVINGHKCSGNFSGNFLNWATMTRMGHSS